MPPEGVDDGRDANWRRRREHGRSPGRCVVLSFSGPELSSSGHFGAVWLASEVGSAHLKPLNGEVRLGGPGGWQAQVTAMQLTRRHSEAE